jgi:dTDP-4-dehydrorhamnose reductase
MIDQRRMIFTGGSGLLGRAVRGLLEEACFPAASEFNVLDYDQMDRFVRAGEYSGLVHAAAFTSPPRIDQDPVRALETNIVGTANVVRLCATHNLHLVYISTDYVFRGDRGSYREDDELHPVNKYAWSKLGGECAVRLYDRSLIIRTSFGPDVFPYPAAFEDQWTSRQPVTQAARQIVEAVRRDLTGVIHIGGPRRTVLEYARSLDSGQTIKAISTRDVNFPVPKDTSLDSSRFHAVSSRREPTRD